jgi:pantoate--beta-alanine ligase
MTEVLCGRSRPGHFVGVATIVTKLLNIIQPDRAYFGQKDGQQVAIIRQLVQQLNLPVVIVPVPTLREVDGLALSSRNVYLTPAERKIAPGLYQGLQQVTAAVSQGERRVQILCDLVINHLGNCSTRNNHGETAPEFKIDYVAMVTAATLTPITDYLPSGERVMVAVAAKLGRARLIDNILLDVVS